MCHNDTKSSAASGDRLIRDDLSEMLAVLACAQMSVGDVHSWGGGRPTPSQFY